VSKRWLSFLWHDDSMQGVRLFQNCFSVHTRDGIRNIVDCLVPEISQRYCVTHGEFLLFSTREGKTLSDEAVRSFDRKYEHFLMEQHYIAGSEIPNVKLFDRGFLESFRDCLYGDWNHFYLLTSKIPLNVIQLWSNNVPPGCDIFICCVDAAYWEVFVRDAALLERLKGRFPEAVPCNLEDKTF